MIDRPLVADGSHATEPFAVSAPGEAPPPMIDFRGHNGTAFALPYDDLTAVTFHPIDCMVMEFRAHRVVVRGRNLRAIYDGVLQHRVRFLQEDRFDDRPETEPFVDAITVEYLHEPA